MSVIASTLYETAEKIKGDEDMIDVRISLRNQALHLMTYQENLVDPMTEQTIEMLQMTKKLDESFRFGKDSFEKGIDSILEELETAQDFIRDQASSFVREVTFNFIPKPNSCN